MSANFFQTGWGNTTNITKAFYIKDFAVLTIATNTFQSSNYYIVQDFFADIYLRKAVKNSINTVV